MSLDRFGKHFFDGEKMKRKITLGIAVVAAISFAFCSKKKEEAAETGTLQMGLKLAGTSTITSLDAFNADAAATDFRNTSVASGAPSEMKLTITKMALKTADGAEKTIFSESAGREIIAKSGHIDISQLFTSYACLDSQGDAVEGLVCPCGLDKDKKVIEKDSSGQCPVPAADSVAAEGLAQVEEGTFTSLVVSYQVAAKMKGCVTGNYGTIETRVSGVHTYCTVSGKDSFSGGGEAADFEISSSSAAETSVQLNKTNTTDTDKTKTFFQEYPIAGGGIEIKKDSTARLTMVIDNNRMLRFFNNNKTNDQTPNPGMLSGKSYFFNTVFEESSFVFVGEPGDIRGFQWWLQGCKTSASVPKPTDRVCTTAAGATVTVAGWMTIIKDSNNKPLVIGLMPDDDNTATLVKGSNKNQSGIDANKFTLKSGTTYDIGFMLGDKIGTIYGIDVDGAVGTVQVGSFESDLGLGEYYGKFYVKRGL